MGVAAAAPMNTNANLRQIARAALERQKVLDKMHRSIFDVALAARNGTVRDMKNALAEICKLIDPTFERKLNYDQVQRVEAQLDPARPPTAAPDFAETPARSPDGSVQRLPESTSRRGTRD